MKTINNLFVICSLLLICSFSNAQSLGLNVEQEIKEFQQVIKLPFLEGSKGEEIPLRMSHKEHCPPIINQGSISSCVGWSSGYGLLTMLYSQKNSWTKEQIKENAFSALFIYNSIKSSDCNGGATLALAGERLKEYGDCKSSQFDIDTESCWSKPDETLLSYAQDYRIKSYYAAFDYGDTGAEKVAKLKRVIAEGDPVLIGMLLKNNFYRPTGEFWEAEEGDTRPAGGHAMVIVGYDDTKRAFEVMNSWGKHWGNNGFLWVRYKDFADNAVGAYRFVLEDSSDTVEDIEIVVDNTTDKVVDDINDSKVEEEKIVEIKPVTLTGKFDFRTLVSDEYGPIVNGKGEFQWSHPKQVKEEEYLYGLERKDWKKYDKFQLLLTEAQKDSYIYAFSVDANGLNVHWPRQKELSFEKFQSFGAGEAALIPRKNAKIIIPGEETALQREATGDDNICILYSNTEITDFKNRIDKLEAAEGDFQVAFQATFGDLLIPIEDIEYEKKEMEFISETKSGKSVVPLILVVTDDSEE